MNTFLAMNRKVTIIGAGSVGASIAYTAVVKGVASEIVLIDINKDKTLGEAMDIRQGIPFCTPCDGLQPNDQQGLNAILKCQARCLNQ